MTVVCLSQILDLVRLALYDKSKRLLTNKGASKPQYIQSVSCF